MPSIVTHHLFAEEVYNHLSTKTQNKLKNAYPIYQIFAQSFDNLFYYKFFTPWQGKQIRALGNIAQKNKTDTYFKNLINFIKQNNLINNPDLLAYLYGSINHYVLDYNCHPFVFYYTGDPKLNKKYRGLHEKLEVNMDAYMLKKLRGKELKKEKLADTLLPIIHFNSYLKQGIDYTFESTFNTKNMGKIYEKSYHTGHTIIKYFVTDHLGIKKQIYGIVDFFTPLSHRRYKNLSFHVTKIIPEYTNEQHETWFNPWSLEPSNLSFYELFEKSQTIAVNLIESIEAYFQNQINEQELTNILKDYSYTTGLSWHIDTPIKKLKR